MSTIKPIVVLSGKQPAQASTSCRRTVQSKATNRCLAPTISTNQSLRLETVRAGVALAALLCLLASDLASALGQRGAQRMGRNRDTSEQELQTCHLRELDLCLAPIAVFTQSSNSQPVSNQEINRQCKIMLETEVCLKNFTQRCLTGSQGQFLYMFADGGLDLVRELCRPGSSLRTSYLKHGDCINGQQKAQRVCMRDFQVSLERAVDIDWQSRLKLGCW